MELIKLEVKPMNCLLIQDNYEEVKKQVEEIANKYKGLQFNDVEIKEAKKIVAELNKIQKEANDLKISVKKEVSKPITEFEDKVKSLIAIIEEPKEAIKLQVDDYIERSKTLKKTRIINTFNELKKDLPINFDLIFNEKWLNETTSEKSVLEEMTTIISKFEEDYKIIKGSDSEFKIQMEDVFLKTLSLSQGLSERIRLEDIKKKNFERQLEENKKQEEIAKQLNLEKNKTVNIATGEVIKKEKEYTFILKITTTATKKDKLKDFLINNFIKYEI